MVEMAFDPETNRLESSTVSGQWPRGFPSRRVLQKVSRGVDCTEVLRGVYGSCSGCSIFAARYRTSRYTCTPIKFTRN
ncbi:hypothetical protein ASPCAL01148 [Aspergillus calidoustus]|uniref:Uncharacterized protein n=1 Tax=Aspergillus calidoustus TaxID=454130 RepID=A0A0U5FWX9_ASPCI|nr:hypothetical protein ASPCAL01148 [Aspergillus calidoustus]